MSFLKFLKSKKFFLHLAIAIAVGFALLFGTFGWMNIYTHHGEALPVPDFKGLTLQEAEQLAKDKKLLIEITDSVFLPDKKRGSVIAQSPNPDFKVKENRSIFLTMNAFYPERVQIPDLIGVSIRQADSYLQTFGLKVGKIKYVPDIGKNVVLKQNYKGKLIKPGTWIEKGSSIDLVLGKGETDEKATVPNLIGMNYQAAIAELGNATLNIGAVVGDETVKSPKDSARATIWKQSPMPHKDAQISLGATVDIWISLKKATEVTDTTATEESEK